VSGVWFWIPSIGPIRISTLLGAVVVFTVVAVGRRSILAGIVTVVAWTSVFETIYHVVGIVGYHWPMADFVWGTAAVAGWVILAWLMGIRPDWRISVLFLVAMTTWIVTGFHYNVAGQVAPLNWGNEILNEVTKSLLGLAYLIGALRGAVLPSRTEKQELVEELVNR